jgi:hypothetical protein
MPTTGHLTRAADPDTKINYLIPVDVANADDEDLWTNSLNLNNVVEGLRSQAPGATTASSSMRAETS